MNAFVDCRLRRTLVKRFYHFRSLPMSGLVMPALNAQTIARRDEIIADMKIIVPGEGVVHTETGMRPFETDALTAYRQMPLVVVLPETVQQVSRILKYCHDRNI